MSKGDSISKEIFISRDKTREQIVDYAKEYLDLENIDLTKSSFLTFIIDIMSTLTSNLMFYQTNTYKEFFMTQAQLPESVNNLSSFLGYSPKNAVYATANLLVTIQFGFTDPDTEFTLKNGFMFKSTDGVEFITYYKTTVKVTTNSSVLIQLEDDSGRIYNIPTLFTTVDSLPVFQFVLPTRQQKITIQEFQIDPDLELYQFSNIFVPFTKKLASLELFIRDPGESTENTGILYTEFSSVYLMSHLSTGYVLRKTTGGRTIHFGNGLMGKQPPSGGTVIVHLKETLGKSGNVIKSSITSGDRIYSEQLGVNTIVDYKVTNSSTAFGGEDEESLQDIRVNSIQSLTSLNRLVSENDFKNAKSILKNAPIASNSIPVLKRSDLKINEIQLFITLDFAGEIVPAKNIYHSVTLGTTYLPRGTIITIDNIQYITLFEINIDPLNSLATYNYIVSSIEAIPILNQSWSHPDQDNYHFHGENVIITKVGSGAKVDFVYKSTESNFSSIGCIMRISENDAQYTMTNVPGTGGGTLTYTFSDYNDIASGVINIFFKISNPNLTLQPLISEYSTSLTFQQDLKSFMVSNTMDSTSTIIYDIPVIQKTYYDNLESQSAFESEVLQKLLSSLTLINYRMLTDFINIKFCNSTGKMKNMLNNKTTKQNIKNVGLWELPSSGVDGDRYTISSDRTGVLADKKFDIVELVDSTAMTWTYISPTTNDTILATDDNKKYIYSQSGWVHPTYDIPLQISLEVFKDADSSISEATVIQDIKTAILEKFQDQFGPNITIFRADIIEVVQSIPGVINCRLLTPETSIIFNFEIDDMTQDELLKYSPEWIYFTEDDISIRLLASE